MKDIFDTVSARCSEITTKAYSTSFSLGIKFLDRKFHKAIYGVYGFVRFADEIVDSFHGYDKKQLLEKFRRDTYEAIENRISLNPILNSYQEMVHRYGIERELTDTFLESMEMDLGEQTYNRGNYEKYIFGSAEVVGLMCLRVFTEGNTVLYEKLKPFARKLGAGFQKVNFLRDMKQDYEVLGRTYFPGVNFKALSQEEKQRIEDEIEVDFREALKGIQMLPDGSRRGVYLAYYYYRTLLQRIKRVPPKQILNTRIGIQNWVKFLLMFKSYLRYRVNAL
jgi:phytoene synthase